MGAPEAFTQNLDVAHWIGGAPQRGSGTRAQTVWNPATGAAAAISSAARARATAGSFAAPSGKPLSKARASSVRPSARSARTSPDTTSG